MINSLPEKSFLYQLKITLDGTDPMVWRRILVIGNISLEALHTAIQSAMGWKNSHGYMFAVGSKRYSDPRFEIEMNEDDSRTTRLAEIAKAGSSFEYQYDFGDDWHHRVQVERIAQADDRYIDKPVCIEGENACPPEDCGGIHEYYEKLEILKNSRHPEYKDIVIWLGTKSFDPKAFDLNL